MDQLALCSVYLLSGGVSRMGDLKVWTKDRPPVVVCFKYSLLGLPHSLLSQISLCVFTSFPSGSRALKVGELLIMMREQNLLDSC